VAGKVKYIAEHYTSTGTTYYYKQQILKDTAPFWSKPRPISEKTYNKAKTRGEVCEYLEIKRNVADVISFDELLRYKMLREELKNNG
jgi:hypothetical protein